MFLPEMSLDFFPNRSFFSNGSYTVVKLEVENKEITQTLDRNARKVKLRKTRFI